MKSNTSKFFLFICLLILFDFLFWQQRVGINVALFTTALLGAVVYNAKDSLIFPQVRVALLGTLLSGILFVIHHSIIAFFAHAASFVITVGFIQQVALRSVVFAMGYMALNFFRIPLHLFGLFKGLLGSHKKVRRPFAYVRLTIVPLLVVLIFYAIFVSANPVFAQWSEVMFGDLAQWIDRFFRLFDSYRFWFLFLGTGIIVWALFKMRYSRLAEREQQQDDDLVRKRIKRPNYGISPLFNTLALKHEYRSSAIMLVLVNILLLIVNIIDIDWLWFSFSMPEGVSRKQLVHEGTYLLILSIVLSMVILLHVFRRNQNFYKDRPTLRKLAYLWIAQNAILCFSVFLRNYHYIDFHGLAYKRIGVIAFLLLTIVGLYTMYLKISQVKTGYYLLRTNSWAAYGMLIALGLVNWDVVIAKHNLNHWNSDGIEVDFYHQLSYKTMPVIYAHLDEVKTQIEAHAESGKNWSIYSTFDEFKRQLDYRRGRFLNQQQELGWQSWNWAEAKAWDQLSTMVASEKGGSDE